MKQIQDATIGAIYNMVRDINHSVAELANDLIEKVQTAEQALQESDEK